jgi:ring-1,2-phenylacetyl-CoA epoxidase subunit PaaE
MPKFHLLTVKDIRRETPDCVSIAFEVPPELENAYAYTPGQYLTLRVFFNGEEVRRSYSICSTPREGELRVAVKRAPYGRFSTYANEHLRVGDRLDVMTPMGRFGVSDPAARGKHYVAFAAGSGITPIISILKAVLAQSPDSHFTLFYGNRATDAIIFREALEGLKNRYLHRLSLYYVLSRETPDSPLFNGRIDARKCRLFFDKLVDIDQVDAFLLCGPMAMNEALRATLLELGAAPKSIHQELFAAAGVSAPARALSSAESDAPVKRRARITLDGNTFEINLDAPNLTILEAALRAGADLPFACKGGVCSTCRAKLIAGEVDMPVHYALEEEEVAAGYILTCQSYPISSLVTVNFDA